MKGIILAAGLGSRMYPTTKAISKHLITVYDKPAIYYPLSVLMLMGISEIAIITNPEDQDQFKELLGGGSELGLRLNYLVQEKPKGIPDAFVIGEQFIGNDSCCLLLGDNFFYGYELPKRLKSSISENEGATCFTMNVKEPQNFGVVKFSSSGEPEDIIEKPKKYISNSAVTGLYLFNNKVIEIAKKLEPSSRGETEIVEVLNEYLRNKELKVTDLGRGTAWLDTGTPEGLLGCADFVKTIEDRQGLKISCLEEISFKKGFITSKQLVSLVEKMPKSPYRDYLQGILKN